MAFGSNEEKKTYRTSDEQEARFLRRNTTWNVILEDADQAEDQGGPSRSASRERIRKETEAEIKAVQDAQAAESFLAQLRETASTYADAYTLAEDLLEDDDYGLSVEAFDVALDLNDCLTENMTKLINATETPMPNLSEKVGHWQDQREVIEQRREYAKRLV